MIRLHLKVYYVSYPSSVSFLFAVFFFCYKETHMEIIKAHRQEKQRPLEPVFSRKPDTGVGTGY